MRRRNFIAALGATAALWPLVGRAEQPGGKRHIAFLLGGLERGDAEGQAEVAAFEEGLKQLGWNIGSDIEIDYRWPGAALDQIRAAVKEIANSRPDMVLSRATPATTALINTNLPVVFVLVADPIGSGFIQSFAKPGGNFTGLATTEASIAGKWLALLTEIAPAVNHIALIFNPATAPFAGGYLNSAEQSAQTLGVVLKPAPVSNPVDIDTALAAITGEGGGLIVIPDTFLSAHRDLIVSLAARYRLPTIYGSQLYSPIGGLMSYAVNFPDLSRRAARYVDDILKGAKPAELPVQLPTRFTLTLNLKTAKALGLTIPQPLLATADEVIE